MGAGGWVGGWVAAWLDWDAASKRRRAERRLGWRGWLGEGEGVGKSGGGWGVKEGGGWVAGGTVGPELGEPCNAAGSYSSSRNRIRTLVL